MGDAPKCEKCGSDVPAGAACARCALAAALPSADAGPTADEVAAKLPAFEILGVLGRGGMGVVFKARQKALDRIVALKVLPPATAQTPGFADRFQREAKAMARLAHPNIVAVHEFGESGGLFYLVLEFVDGLNVREAMTAGRIRPGEALTIVPQICDALQYAHDRGVVHRDIKPENVMIDREGRVRIADFGLAKLADRESGDPSLTGAGQVMGTLRYMAPEQWERPKEVDHRADIYSLGVVFYEMLTGELPMGKFEPPSSKAHVDVRIDDVVMRAIERDRERRWQNASDVRTRVGEIASGVAVPPPPLPTPPEPASAPRSKPSILPVVAPLLVAILCGVIAIVVRPDSPGTSTVFWWLAGLTFFATIVVAVVCWDRARRGVRGPPWPFDSKDESDEEEPEPKGKWLPTRTIALLTLAGISAAAVLCGGFTMGPAGMTFSGIAFVLGLALWTMYDARKKQVLDAEKGAREFPGPPVAIDILSAVMIVVGLIGVWNAAFAKHEDDPDDGSAGTKVTVGFGGVTIKSRSKPTSEDGAPWEFVVEATSGETPSRESLDAQRQDLWKTWIRAQALQDNEWTSTFMSLYTTEDYGLVNSMKPDARKRSADEGVLGLPLYPRASAPLGKFRIERVRLGGWSAPNNRFESAQVRATDGEKTLRFTMRWQGGFWLFVAAPVELE